MKIKILTKGIDLEEKTEIHIKKKISSLESVVGKDENNLCNFRVGKNSGSHRHGKIFFAEATIDTLSKNYGARHESESLLGAIDGLKEELSKKIRRYKSKRLSMVKKGGRMVKDFLRRIKE